MSNTIAQPPTFELEGDDLVILKDTFFDKKLEVKGDIKCKNGRHSLIVFGNISARNIDAKNISAENIDANDIDAFDITANDIMAGNIKAHIIEANDIHVFGVSTNDIDVFGLVNGNDTDTQNVNTNILICEKRIKKTPDAKTTAKSFIENRFSIGSKEQMPVEKK